MALDDCIVGAAVDHFHHGPLVHLVSSVLVNSYIRIPMDDVGVVVSVVGGIGTDGDDDVDAAAVVTMSQKFCSSHHIHRRSSNSRLSWCYWCYWCSADSNEEPRKGIVLVVGDNDGFVGTSDVLVESRSVGAAAAVVCCYFDSLPLAVRSLIR